jgi:hypothetical protein
VPFPATQYGIQPTVRNRVQAIPYTEGRFTWIKAR